MKILKKNSIPNICIQKLYKNCIPNTFNLTYLKKNIDTIGNIRKGSLNIYYNNCIVFVYYTTVITYDLQQYIFDTIILYKK